MEYEFRAVTVKPSCKGTTRNGVKYRTEYKRNDILQCIKNDKVHWSIKKIAYECSDMTKKKKKKTVKESEMKYSGSETKW